MLACDQYLKVSPWVYAAGDSGFFRCPSLVKVLACSMREYHMRCAQCVSWDYPTDLHTPFALHVFHGCERYEHCTFCAYEHCSFCAVSPTVSTISISWLPAGITVTVPATVISPSTYGQYMSMEYDAKGERVSHPRRLLTDPAHGNHGKQNSNPR